MPHRRRLLALAVVVALGLALAPGAPGLAQDTDRPVAHPDAPAASAEALAATADGGVTVDREGTVAHVRGVDDHPWVYLFVYPSGSDEAPIGTGWQAPVDGVVTVDLALMAAGDQTLAVVADDGEPIGWVSTSVATEESHGPATTAADDATAPQPSSPSASSAGGDEGNDGGLAPPVAVGIGAAAVVLVGAALLLRRRARRRLDDGTDPTVADLTRDDDLLFSDLTLADLVVGDETLDEDADVDPDASPVGVVGTDPERGAPT